MRNKWKENQIYVYGKKTTSNALDKEYTSWRVRIWKRTSFIKYLETKLNSRKNDDEMIKKRVVVTTYGAWATLKEIKNQTKVQSNSEPPSKGMNVKRSQQT